MKHMFIIGALYLICAINAISDEYRWKKIKEAGTYDSEKLAFSPTGYDRENNVIYSMKYVNDVLTVMAYDIDKNTVYEIPNMNAPRLLRTFTYDHTNKRLIAIRSGREHVFALPVSGGTWTKIGDGGSDNESYNAGYFWNEKTNAFGFFGGYGLYSVKNWVWEYQDAWVNTFANNENCSDKVPVKRSPSLILGKPGENKLYFSSGQGNCSGDQFDNSCSIGEPWATDIGKYCWLKDVWEMDLNTNTFKNLLPVNHASIDKEGALTFNFDAQEFVKVGGFIPPSVYDRSVKWGEINDYSMDVSVFKVGSKDGFVPVKTVGELPPVMKISQLQHNALYYDAKGKRVIYIRGDGVWSLTRVKEGTTAKACGYSIREQDTTICKGSTLQLHVNKPLDSSCFEKEVVCSVMPYEKKKGRELYVSINGDDIKGDGSANNPYNTIQYAIDKAQNFDIVTVMDGEYKGVRNRGLSLRGKRITVQSQNGAHCTIINCEKKDRGFFLYEGETTESLIQGFTIKNGAIPQDNILITGDVITSDDAFFVSPTEEPLDWKTADHVSWNTAQAPFGKGYGGSFATKTDWALGTKMYLRKTVSFDNYNTDSLLYKIAVDNGFKLYLNGILIDSGMKEHAPNRWDYSGIIKKEFIKTGDNILALEIIDKGVKSYFEMQLQGKLQGNTARVQEVNDRGNLIYVDNHTGITIKNCVFESNTDGIDLAFGKGEVSNSQESVIESSIFRKCIGTGNVILSDKKTVTINECVFDGNKKVLHANAHYSNPPSAISNCIFKNNEAENLVQIHHSKKLTNSIFANNKSTIGLVYAATTWSGLNEIDHCVFYNNQATYYHSSTYDHVGIVRNTIFSGLDNNGRNHVSGNQDYIQYEYSNGTGFSGLGNLEAEPLFVNPSLFNFALSSNSPLVQAGENGTDMGVDMTKYPAWMLDSLYDEQPKRDILSFEWSTGMKDSIITIMPDQAMTYYLFTKHGNNTYVDSIKVDVSEAYVDIFGQTKIHQRQVNHAYYTEYHDGSVYQWEVTGNAELASSNGGSSILVNFKDPGYAYIKVTETNKYSCLKDTMLTVRVYGLTDIAEGIMGNASMMSVFPNPVGNEDVITIRTMMSPGRDGVIELLDVLGTQLFSVPTYAQASYQEYMTQIPIGEYPNGMYMIRYYDGENTVLEKLLINR